MKEKDSVHEAFTELAPRYENVVDHELMTFWGWSYQDFIDRLLEQTTLEPGQKLLDIATGTAVIPRKLADRGFDQNQIIGLDITEAMLHRGIKRIDSEGLSGRIHLTCGDALTLPFAQQTFDIVVTGLASHHMDIDRMLSEVMRVLKTDALFSMIDVGSTPFWRLPVIRFFSRIFAFFYFLITENFSRAWAEAQAVTNVRTAQEWRQSLADLGFRDIDIQPLPSKYAWLPEPLAIRSRLIKEE